jgi:hypothetical protein
LRAGAASGGNKMGGISDSKATAIGKTGIVSVAMDIVTDIDAKLSSWEPLGMLSQGLHPLLVVLAAPCRGLDLQPDMKVRMVERGHFPAPRRIP